MWDIEYYDKPDGSCPVFEFLHTLPKDALPKVRRKIELLEEFGNGLIRPHADYLEDGLYELRIRYIRNQVRLLYFFHGNEIVILCGLEKEDEIPPQYIKRANEYRMDYLDRKGSGRK